MHISEGVLALPVLAAGAGVAIAGIAMGLKKMPPERLPMAGALSAAFFVASLVHVPVGLANAHLLLVGLTGVLLGWGAFPAIFTALLLQALLFQYGGITTLGVNTATMGLGALGAWGSYLLILRVWPHRIKTAAFFAGALGIAVAAILTAASLAFTDEGFVAAAAALLIAHVPVMFAEGFITMFTIAFLARLRPELLPGRQIQEQAI